MLYNHQFLRQIPRDNLPIINLNITEKIRYFLTHNPPDTPFLVLDLDVIMRKLLNIRYFFSFAKIYYAIKANSHENILKMLVNLGTNFDTASIPEIKQCLQAGAKPLTISFGNTIKKEKDIAEAYNLGVRLFCFDSQPELEKIARSAPGSQVYCRILTENQGAEWPLSKKFGCELNMAENLLLLSAKLGLEPLGVSFHVGSQQKDPNQWDGAIAKVAQLFARLAEHGVKLKMINLGGGFPAHYGSPILPEKIYAEAIIKSLHKYFGVNLPEVMIEPGRSLVGDAGVIQTEVILISYKSEFDIKRWIFLDIGKFGGLIETLDESIKYRICTPYDGQATGPVILAGPTCDSADILYEKSCYELPLALQIGDRLSILSTGAYTHSYSSISFNGFPPLKVYCI